MKEDPAKDGLNWYSYCGNNPITFHDPTGQYYVVQDRYSEHIAGGDFYLGEHTGTYSIVSDSFPVVVASGFAAAIPIPFVGGIIGKRIQPSSVLGDVIGGTSDFSNIGSEMALTASQAVIGFATRKANFIGPFFRGLGMTVTRGTIYDLDKTLFGLMSIYNMPTTEFKDIQSLENQMTKLHSIVSENPAYFGSFEHGYGNSDFLKDYHILSMSDDQREARFRSEAARYFGEERIERYNYLVDYYNDTESKIKSFLD